MILALPGTVIRRGNMLSAGQIVRKGEGVPEPWALWAHDTEAYLLVLYLPQAFQYQCGPCHARRQDSQSGIPMEVTKLKKKSPQKLASHIVAGWERWEY